MDQKHKSQQKIISIIAAVIVIVGLAYVFSKAQNSTTPKNTSTSSSSVVTKNSIVGGGSNDITKSLLSYDGLVFYNQVNDGITTIYSKSAQSEAKVIFTDKDEGEKIKSIGGVTSDGNILVLLAGADAQFAGELYLIKTDGSGTKTKIVDEFASPQAPKISPDGRLIAYVLFSNVETDYGFSLYIMNLSGQNKIKIDQNSTLINNIDWSADSQKIAYLKGNIPQMKITVSEINGQNQNDIYQVPEGQTVNYLNWDSTNIIFVVNNISDTTQSEVLSIDPSSHKTKNIFQGKSHIGQSFWASKEENNFFLLTGDKNDTGLYTLNIATSNNETADLGSASAIIGWQQ